MKMNRFLNFINRDTLECPYLSCCKSEPFSLGAAAVMGGASILGNILGFGSSSKANETNLEIARMNADLQRETNAQQYKIFQEQNAFNYDMWNKTNEYNSPEKVKSRLLAAGINPSAVFGTGTTQDAGQLLAAQSPNLTAPQLNARVNPYDFDLSGVGNAVSAYFQNQVLKNEADSKGIDNQAKMIDLEFKRSQVILNMQEQLSRINQNLQNTKKGSAEYDNLLKQKELYELQLRKTYDTYDSLVEREKLTNDVLIEQKKDLISSQELKRADAYLKSLTARYLPALTNAQINQINAQVGVLIEQANELVHQHKLTDANATKVFLESNMQRILNKEKAFKHGYTYGTHGTAMVKAFSDYVGDLIFGNMRFFGK